MFRTVVEPTLLQSIAIANAPVPAYWDTPATLFWDARYGTPARAFCAGALWQKSPRAQSGRVRGCKRGACTPSIAA
jgi:hypothetical protein